MIRFKGVEGQRKMRNNDHETRFCGNVGGGGLRRRIYSRLCPRGLWAWRRVCEPWRLRAQSYHSPGITSAADACLPKPDSGPARGTFAAARDQRAVGAKPLWGSYVAASAGNSLNHRVVEHCLQQGGGLGGDARFAWPAAHSAAGRSNCSTGTDPPCCGMTRIRKADLQLVAYRFGAPHRWLRGCCLKAK